MMSTLLQQLENNEAILLMYLAGELPEADRVEVEQMLVNDESLRSTMAELAALQADVGGALNQLDIADAPAFARRESSVRRVMRAMAAADEDGRAVATFAAPPEPARGPLRFRWFAYPVAAAALLVIGFFVLSSRAPSALPPQPDAMRIVAQEMSAPTPRIFDVNDDPALDRLEHIEQQVLSLHMPDDALFDLEADVER